MSMASQVIIDRDYMVVSQNRGTQYRVKYSRILIMGIPKMGPLLLGNPHILCNLVVFGGL